MTTIYREKFPLTVSGSGFKYRHRLDGSPRCERLSQQMSRIYTEVDLHPDDRDRLLKLHAALFRAFCAVQNDKQFRHAGWDGISKFKAVELDFREFEQRVGANEGVL